jgi:hypothetical protein
MSMFFYILHTCVNFNNSGVAPLNPTSTSVLCSTLPVVNFIVVLDCVAKFYMVALCLIFCVMPEEVGCRQPRCRA